MGGLLYIHADEANAMARVPENLDTNVGFFIFHEESYGTPNPITIAVGSPDSHGTHRFPRAKKLGLPLHSPCGTK